MLRTPPTSLERAVDRHEGERPFPRLAHCRGVGGVGGSDTDGRCTESGVGVHDGVVAMRGHALRPEEGDDLLVAVAVRMRVGKGVRVWRR